jgi:hypothetical protein
MPYSIDQHLVETIEQYASVSLTHNGLLGRVSAHHPAATLRDIARAALYAATNPTPVNETMPLRLDDFALAVRRLA